MQIASTEPNPALDLRCFRRPYEKTRSILCTALAIVAIGGAWSGEGYLVYRLGPHHPTVAWTSVRHPSAIIRKDKKHVDQAITVLKDQFGRRVPTNSEMYWALNKHYPVGAVGTAADGPFAAGAKPYEIVAVNNASPPKPVLYAPGGKQAVEATINPGWNVSYRLHESARPDWMIELIALLASFVVTLVGLQHLIVGRLYPKPQPAKEELRRADRKTWSQLVDQTLPGAETPIEGFVVVRPEFCLGTADNPETGERPPIFVMRHHRWRYSNGRWVDAGWGSKLDASGEIPSESENRWWFFTRDDVAAIESRRDEMIAEAQAINSRNLEQQTEKLLRPTGSAKDLAAMLPEPHHVEQPA